MNTNQCRGPISRRSFLTMGTLGVAGLSLGDVMRLRAAEGRSAAPDTSVIFIWLAGGPPHMDTYDLKPEAPEEYRGQFRPIRTNVPGIDICELLPLHAKCADKYTLIRSISHTFSDHGGGSKRVMTGRIPATPTETVNDAPAVCTIVSKMREHIDIGLPNVISGADDGRTNVDTYAQGSAYLSRRYTPFMVGDDPSRPNFQVRNIGLDQEMATRLDDRFRLLQGVDGLRRQMESNRAMATMDANYQRAYSLMTSPQARLAFDLSREPRQVRDRYGMHA